MRIRSLDLQNFQIHAEQHVELSTAITTIKGATDKGKSAILRALRWICLNDFAGKEFIKEGEKEAVVSITIADNGGNEVKITRTKGQRASNNTYELEGHEFKSFGQAVPEDITKILNVNDINFQSQHEPPFWFNESAAEVSRRLNAVIDLGVIDSALSYTAGQVHRGNERKSVCEERVEELSQQLKELSPQRKRIKQFKALEQLDNERQDAQNNFDRLEGLIRTVHSNRAKVLDEQADEGTNLLRLGRSLLGLQQSVSSLDGHIATVKEAALLSTRPDDFSGVTRAYRASKKCWDNYLALEAYVTSLTVQIGRAAQTDKTMKKVEAAFHKAVKGKKCPLCQNRIQ